MALYDPTALSRDTSIKFYLTNLLTNRAGRVVGDGGYWNEYIIKRTSYPLSDRSKKAFGGGGLFTLCVTIKALADADAMLQKPLILQFQ